MVVMKFGGTSVKDASTIKNSISIVKNKHRNAWVVVSALSGVTNLLVLICEELKLGKIDKVNQICDELELKHLNLAEELGISQSKIFVENYFNNLKTVFFAVNILGELTPKSMDLILASGEILSSRIISDYCSNIGLNSLFVDSTQIISTDTHYNAAEVDFDTSKSNIDYLLMQHSEIDYFICGGFIGSDDKNNTTTLGRGGSDYTAAIIAWALSSEALEIWTDVDGILTSDPRMVKDAKILTQVSYQEAAELAYFGAKVLHPKTIYPAISLDIPVYVLNSFNPLGSGTLIQKVSHTSNLIKSIAFRRDIILINIISNRMLGAYGFLSKVFEVFKNAETSVDLVSTSEVSISLTIDKTDKLESIIEELSKFALTEIYYKMAVISAIGDGIRDTSGIASRFFTIMKGINISLITFGASEVNLSIVIHDDDLESAVQLLHNEFFSNNINQDLFKEIK